MEEDKIKLNDPDLKVLRTYGSDMADAVRTNEASVIKIALAEKNKREKEEIYKKAEGTNLSKILLIVGGIIFIVAAIFGSSFLIKKKKTTEVPTLVTNNIDTFITYDSTLKIDVTNITNTSGLISKINQTQDVNSGLIKALFLIKDIDGVSSEITSKDFLSILGSTAPGALTRSMSDKYLVGKFLKPNTASGKIEPKMFLIFQINEYALAYASMLDWEKTITRDLYTFFDLNINDTNNEIFEKQWKDIIVNNRDARVLYGENGEGVLYYSFINKDKLVIAGDLEALKELIARIIIKNAKP